MYRYIAMIGSAGAEEPTRAMRAMSAQLQTAGWSVPIETPSLRVFEIGARPTGPRAHVLLDSGGVVLGTVFASCTDALDDTPCHRWAPTSVEIQAILASRGRAFFTRCWGNYVAVLTPPGASRLWVLKDPTGGLPCWIATDDRATFLCSSPVDLVHTKLTRLRIRSQYLQDRTLGIPPRESSLDGAKPVHRGECVEFDTCTGHIRGREFYWCPQGFAESGALDGADRAARALRARMRSCTHSWATAPTRLLHRLSGGLDSSIVAGCLKDAPARPQACAYTYFNPQGHSDELPWARMAARQSQLEHRLIPVTPDDIDLELALKMPPLAEPAPVLGFLLRSTIEQALATEKHATMVMTGDGGDSGFGAEAARYAAADYWRRRGFNRELLRIASAVALRTDRSAGAVLYEALQARVTGAMPDWPNRMLPQVSRLVPYEVLVAQRPTAPSPHPWFDKDEKIPWDLVRRLGALLGSPEMYDVVPGEEVPQVVSPLYSQPVVETLLQIPLYRLFEDGRDRGLARRAFAQDVPEPILERLWKDRSPGFHARVIFQHRRFLHNILVDGVLVRAGLLDPAAIDQALSDSAAKNEVLPAEIMGHLDVEIWARSWAGVN